MLVLHALSSLEASAGGPTAALLGLACAQIDLGIKVRVLGSCNPVAHSIVPALLKAGADVTLVEFPKSAGSVANMIKVVGTQTQGVDIVHVHGLWELLPTTVALGAWHKDIPFVMRPCGMLDQWSLTQHAFIKKLHLRIITGPILNRASLIHATTTQERREIERLRLRTPVLVAHNGVDNHAFESVGQPQGILSKLATSRRVVLFLGRVHPKKGVDALISAMELVTMPDVVLVVMGPGENSYIKQLLRQVNELGIGDRVLFLDPSYGIERFAAYRSADLFVLPSMQENFGITVAEAMACGVPVIVSPEVALSQIVEAEKAGMITSRAPVEVARTIDMLLSDKQLSESMGEHGRYAAEKHFRWRNIAQLWLAKYMSILQERSSRRGHEVT